MSDRTNTRTELVIYANGELHAKATCNQELQVQPEALEKLSAKRGKDVA